jgi:hypothetical protein
MSDTKRGPFEYCAHLLAQIVVGIWVVVDTVLSPVFRPFARWLSSLRVIQSIERGIAALPAYGVLVLLAAPFAAEEIAKVYAFVLMGGGHFKSGLLLYIGCHVFAILVCERIFQAGKSKLMTIGWFARFITWLSGYKERLIDWFKSTAAFRRAMELKNQLRQRARLVLRRTRSALGR